MTILDRDAAAAKAESETRNTPGYCQAWTDYVFGAPAVGDQDGNGRANAVDGWKSEHGHQHDGDRNPPRGVPVAYSGGSHGDGHRAVSLGNGKIRSTDAGGEGVVATVDLDWPEKTWGLSYLGWSDTISGQEIPLPPPTRVTEFHESGPAYDVSLLDKAVANGRHGVVRHARNEIAQLVQRLPHHSGGDNRVDEFVKAFKEKRTLRMHLLKEAVDNGRTGVVKQVHDDIHAQIKQLPER